MKIETFSEYGNTAPSWNCCELRNVLEQVFCLIIQPTSSLLAG